MNKNIQLGDGWQYHYRGTRYHYNSDQKVWWQTSKDGLKVTVKSGHENIIKNLLSLRPAGGSFRITETGDVIMKNEGNDSLKEIFVCEMDEPLIFEEDIEINPQNIQPGDLWPGFYDGARYSFSMDKIWWKNPEGYRQYGIETLPTDIILHFRRFKPQGGSFRITENGYVITLIEKQPLPNELKDQWNQLSTTQQRLVERKVNRTEMLPIYVGRYYAGISLMERQDFSQPLTDDERNNMLDYLDNFTLSLEFEGMVPKDAEQDQLEENEDFLDDPEDWE
jgi:hypothetical protein